MAKKKQTRKGTFSRLRLPVARRYLRPVSRGRLGWIGFVAFALILTLAAADFVLRRGRALSNGPLSSHHAIQEQDCAACHVEFGQTTDAKCSSCHEKFGDRLGVYTFAAHTLYRTTDFQRIVPSEHELACAACHIEHEGRDAEITRVPDRRCLDCHEFERFGAAHPEFAFAREPAPDNAGLEFPHIQHVREVMTQENVADVERSCLYCHNPETDGRSFQPISFDLHCDSCHLTTTTATPRLPIVDPADSTSPGVETLDMIQARGEAGSQWALYTNPGDFRVVGPRVMKAPLYHQDPWVLDNLRRLRQALYPQAGLADLLRASADVPARDLPDLYREAIATLEQYAEGLRGRPEPAIQRDLAAITEALAKAKRELLDPYTALDETEFMLALEEKDPSLDAPRTAEIEALVQALTTPCRQCHTVDKATIARVQSDQRTLSSAEFNHRAHILQRRCLDCHSEMPILELVNSPDPIDPAIDNAAIHNLPRIEACKECHQPRRVSDRCVTCHVFHPDKDRRSDLLLYLETD